VGGPLFGQFLLDFDYENKLSSRRAGETIDCLEVVREPAGFQAVVRKTILLNKTLAAENRKHLTPISFRGS
jgi:hypothetical protein